MPLSVSGSQLVEQTQLSACLAVSGERGIPSSSFGKTLKLWAHCHFSLGARAHGPVSHPLRGVTGIEELEAGATDS